MFTAKLQRFLETTKRNGKKLLFSFLNLRNLASLPSVKLFSLLLVILFFLPFFFSDAYVENCPVCCCNAIFLYSAYYVLLRPGGLLLVSSRSL